MVSMSYCCFENTEEELAQCQEYIDKAASETEHRSRVNIVKICAEIIFNYAGAESVEEAVAWAETLPKHLMDAFDEG